MVSIKKVQVGNDQEKAQSEGNVHPKNRGGKILNRQLGAYTRKLAYRKSSGQLFLNNRRPLSYPNLTKTMKTYSMFKQHKHSTLKHK